MALINELAAPVGMSAVTGLERLDRMFNPAVDAEQARRDRAEWARAAGGEVH